MRTLAIEIVRGCGFVRTNHEETSQFGWFPIIESGKHNMMGFPQNDGMFEIGSNKESEEL